MACETDVFGPDASTDEMITSADKRGPTLDDSYVLPGAMIFDIAATPNGSILLGRVEFGELFFGPNTIKEIGRRGITEVTSIPTPPGSPVNGLAPIGQRNFYAASGGGDRTVGAGLWRASQGNERLLADVSSFTLGSFDFTTGSGEPGPYPNAWKNQRCEPFVGPFSPGPQTNPYQIAAKNGGEVIVADAANNGVIRVRANGEIEVVAFMDPAVLPGDDPADPEDWMVLGEFDLGAFDWDDPETFENLPGAFGIEYDLGADEITCYVEPVPSAVAIGPDGSYYVGDLIGNTPQNFAGEPSPPGLARIWRIEPGTTDARCPSSACAQVEFDDDVELNSVISLAFGPDGKLYVVDFDRNGAAAGFGIIPPGGGALKQCDLESGMCDTILGEEETSLMFPGAITFDKQDNLWLLENVFEPTVRQVSY